MKSQLSWKEYQALEFLTEPTANTASKALSLKLKTRLNHIWQSLVAYFSTSTEPHVWRSEDSNGQVVWHAYDPVTNRSVQQASMDEMRVWLEERHYQTL
ncbi:MAG: hypothetical protein EDM05_040795 [Leptolyngbya sp. IPPAS B-1204]|nr:hypothetical protein [Elainella sp. C42_A2020_010]RNJ68420.1 MAG: hypothetical protein EDM05_15015 [Leptolyngbya sp. IPPAS B-1204]